MIDHDEYTPRPPVLPLALAGDELERYHEVRRLRRLFDPTGERAVRWDENGEVRPGIRYPRPSTYDYPGDPAMGPSSNASGQ